MESTLGEDGGVARRPSARPARPLSSARLPPRPVPACAPASESFLGAEPRLGPDTVLIAHRAHVTEASGTVI